MHSVKFRLDASADSIVLEDDKDLAFSRLVVERYSADEQMLLTFTPANGNIFDKAFLDQLKETRNKLRKLPRVASVMTIIDAPLLKNPPVELKDLLNNIKSLEDPKADVELAKQELLNSPIFKELLISEDQKTTAALLTMKPDKELILKLAKRNEAKAMLDTEPDNPDFKGRYKERRRIYREHRAKANQNQHEDIAAIRAIMAEVDPSIEIHLGGVPMVVDDMVTFIKNDLLVFGIGVFLLVVLTLAIVFKRLRWVSLAVLCCTISVVSMMGLLGLAGWEVTVISSNFISLQIIMTMSLVIHLIVRYRELQHEHPEMSQYELVYEMVRLKWEACLFTTLTTIAGFASLLICDILPVINFGWMMCLGLIVSLLVTFILFPAFLVTRPIRPLSTSKNTGSKLIHFFAKFTENHHAGIIVTFTTITILIVVGISQLRVENSFIDYFRESTEIYQGMKEIDQKLGGTTPLDILINFKEEETIAEEPAVSDTDDEEFDEFDDFSEFDEAESDLKYWFTTDKMAKIKKVHDYLEAHPAIGKELSLETMLEVARDFNEGEALDNFELAVLNEQIPDHYKKILIAPYVSPINNQARINVRIKDSLPGLQRDKLLKEIHHDLTGKLGFKEDEIHIAGVMVLYNNMLQSLFSSQIQTMGFVVIALFIMFMFLFRSHKIAMIAIVPNLISSVAVLGIMGLLDIPLDMMTITIAAISIGIAVDDTIHYIHRFELEYKKDNDYVASMYRCHDSIGQAMYYTTITIIIGFSILAVSNFIPSILFGVLTGVAMLIALFGALTLLPWLIIRVKPFEVSQEA